jgi:hypothetical protein
MFENGVLRTFAHKIIDKYEKAVDNGTAGGFVGPDILFAKH